MSYAEIHQFMDNISNHKEDLVFPYYFGVGAKMRQTQVQTVCENYGIKYVGSDSYARAITTDKVLAKELCRTAGIPTPNCKTLFTEDILPDLSPLKFPVIVKPRFEGDSIGIDKKSVCNNIEDALERGLNLFRDLRVPIIIEEFIAGREMSVCVVGHFNTVKKIGFIEYLKDSPVYGYADKRHKIKLNKYIDATPIFHEEMVKKISLLFTSLDKLEFSRFDFILQNRTFYNIEITTDPTLSKLSGMYWPFKNQNMSFKDFVGFLIANCLERYSLVE